ncbi:MAG: transporter substrate-binding domain-containing protein [Anaerolineae bacterium]|uniref:transporter substrate-binding domain-containing protein n=1 Tax=Promineifilum sp. TaxID=2664178 RepID=UPI001DCBD5C5|nr:transporter substrate-binding domain-containing protein [Anaerolineales bacterium]MCB8935289.1 transporter substrate-binding domain-containing protein [Promineifilum sp.]MCO5178927.1 transporter substrate-binding domain-containing protein [Promineifilum sp.]MCW5847952.1 transporter substrate-binding domain-containing protein [Anaerolineae bacterium]
MKNAIKGFVLPYPIARSLRLGVIMAAMLLFACREAPQPPPTLAPDSTGESGGASDDATGAGSGGTTALAEDAWKIVQQRGRLIVGTSADYPPFAFYTEDFELDGYDIALAGLLGERLGVDVEFKDMAFDGLGGALLVGQIDAAIAAISITDQRREQVDFSTIYFAGEGAALAAAGSGIVINELADLAPYRVAVQEGTVHETWLQEEAVDTGLLPPDNLLVYVAADKAVADLRAGLVDVVVADKLPLEFAARDESLAIVGQGLNRQRFAVALARGSTLLSPVNEALFDLQSEGELARLAEQFLDLDTTEVQPLPEPEATPEASESVRSSNVCIDAMTLIAHLAFDDDGMRSPPPVSPGTPFQKTWRIQNNGTCTWTTGYVLTPVGGNVPQAGMGGAATPIREPVAPGETYDITVNLVSPLVAGVYQGFWSMRSPAGLLFGDRLWVGITVPAQPTPTPPATATVSPSIDFRADRTAIRAGECVIFSWNAGNASDAFFYAQGQQPDLNRVAVAGSQTECPPVTTTYELRVVMGNGTTETRTIRIDVQPSPAAPFFESFSVTPSHQIAVGQCVDVRWRISGDVTTIRVTRNETTLWNGAPLSGTSRDCPPAGEAAYSIVATGPGGDSRALQNVTVLSATPGSGTPTATPAGPLPIINNLAVNPNRIFAGTCLTVSWSVSGSVNRVQLRRDGVLVLDFAVFSGNVTDCLTNEGNYVYRLDATNAQGNAVFQQVSATVVR